MASTKRDVINTKTIEPSLIFHLLSAKRVS